MTDSKLNGKLGIRKFPYSKQTHEKTKIIPRRRSYRHYILFIKQYLIILVCMRVDIVCHPAKSQDGK